MACQWLVFGISFQYHPFQVNRPPFHPNLHQPSTSSNQHKLSQKASKLSHPFNNNLSSTSSFQLISYFLGCLFRCLSFFQDFQSLHHHLQGEVWPFDKMTTLLPSTLLFSSLQFQTSPSSCGFQVFKNFFSTSNKCQWTREALNSRGISYSSSSYNNYSPKGSSRSRISDVHPSFNISNPFIIFFKGQVQRLLHCTQSECLWTLLACSSFWNDPPSHGCSSTDSSWNFIWQGIPIDLICGV